MNKYALFKPKYHCRMGFMRSLCERMMTRDRKQRVDTKSRQALMAVIRSSSISSIKSVFSDYFVSGRLLELLHHSPCNKDEVGVDLLNHLRVPCSSCSLGVVIPYFGVSYRNPMPEGKCPRAKRRVRSSEYSEVSNAGLSTLLNAQNHNKLCDVRYFDP